jgi:hypothetical protein
MGDLQKENIKIFVATDEEPFLEFMQKKFPGKVAAIDAIRSKNGAPIHTSARNGYKKGEDALIDCILLSKCSKLYKMASNLSDVSMRFNPFVPVIHLNTCVYEKINAPSDLPTGLNAILALLNQYEENKIEGIMIDNSSKWWTNNFVPLSVGKNDAAVALTLYDIEILGYETMFEMPCTRAHELIQKYIQFNQHITEKIEKLVEQNFNNSYIIGIYYSKKTPIDYNKLVMQLIKIIKSAPANYKLMLITNDSKLSTEMNSEVQNIFNPIEPNMVDFDFTSAILLSKSNIVVGSASTCLRLVSQLNPKVPVIEMGHLWLEMD